MNREVRIILGPPGTGKTTRLMHYVEHHLRDTPPDRMALVSFSRRSVREVLTRFGHRPDDFPHFRTIHATAFHMLGLSRSDVMHVEHWKQFGELTGNVFKHGGHEEPLWEGSYGDRCLALHDLARARGSDLELELRRTMLPDIRLNGLTRLVEAYERFKQINNLWDFHDMIVKGDGQLDVDVLFVDEAQDTSTAQWSFLRKVARHVPKIYVAGDDDQAVYAWSGADPQMLSMLAGDREILPLSHRLPARIKSLGDRILGRIRHRVRKDFAPRAGDDGSVEWLNDPSHLDLRRGHSWLLLGRSNYQMGQFRDLARQQGVVYTLPNGEWSWTLPSVRAAVVYERLRKGQKITRADARTMSPYLEHRLPEKLPNEIAWGDVFGESMLEANWMDSLCNMPLADKEYVRSLRRTGESLSKPGRVRIGTVHSVKGAEAENVVLLTDVSKRVEQGARVDPDAELRVQYVGVTRAMKNLYLMQPTTPTHWSF